MRKEVYGKTVYFYDEDENEIMHIDYSIDECIWYFNSSNVIKITEDMELYNLLDVFMKQNYVFGKELLQNYKDNNKLIWYSDCYYNPDDKWSVDSVSCLNIEKKDNCFNIWCTKKLDEKINRRNKTYSIILSPLGNGTYSKNCNTNCTLQDDFVVFIYQQLLSKKLVKKFL